MFIDEKKLKIQAGKGGDGAVLFRREIYVPRGGPDGGNGGSGGNIYIEGRSNLHALTHLASVEKMKAEDGQKGGHKTSTGKSGEDLVILVPLGTSVEVLTDGEWQLEGDIIEENQRLLVAKGGNGGWGNWHFRSSVNQAPDRANPGKPGEAKEIRLVLKLIADIGLLGLPNAGKSTFLSVVSKAEPKIADYPFTTLEPQLGVAQFRLGKEEKQLVIADLPGLIEGASQGKGLGIKFLKHMERTSLLLHFLDASQDEEVILTNYQTVRKEVESWSPILAEKRELIVLTKTDLVLPEELESKKVSLSRLSSSPVYSISAVTHQGVTQLLTACL